MPDTTNNALPNTEADSNSRDAALLTRLHSRDPEALSALYDRYGRVVFSLASRMLSDDREIEEVTQDVFLAVWKNPDAYQPDRSSPLTWLTSITRFKCIDRLRKAGRRIPGTPKTLDDQVFIPDDRPASDPFLMSELRELSRQVRECLSRLSETQRGAVEFAYFDGLTTGEIAERYTLPLGTVKSRLRLGMEKLKRCLQPRRREV